MFNSYGMVITLGQGSNFKRMKNSIKRMLSVELAMKAGVSAGLYFELTDILHTFQHCTSQQIIELLNLHKKTPLNNTVLCCLLYIVADLCCAFKITNILKSKT